MIQRQSTTNFLLDNLETEDQFTFLFRIVGDGVYSIFLFFNIALYRAVQFINHFHLQFSISRHARVYINIRWLTGAYSGLNSRSFDVHLGYVERIRDARFERASWDVFVSKQDIDHIIAGVWWEVFHVT